MTGHRYLYIYVTCFSHPSHVPFPVLCSNPHKGIERFGIPLLQMLRHYIINDPFTVRAVLGGSQQIGHPAVLEGRMVLPGQLSGSTSSPSATA